MHAVQSKEGSFLKSSQQNPALLNKEYPRAHFAAVQSVVPVPAHPVHEATDPSPAELLHAA